MIKFKNEKKKLFYRFLLHYRAAHGDIVLSDQWSDWIKIELP